MFPLALLSRRINNLIFQPFAIRSGGIPPYKYRHGLEGFNSAHDLVIYSDWRFIKFVQNEDYWKSYIFAPEISKHVLNHADVLIYYKKEAAISKVAHYTDEDFGSNPFWIDHCPLLQKILLISNSDASALYRYIVIPRVITNEAGLSIPDSEDYNTVCQYYNIL